MRTSHRLLDPKLKLTYICDEPFFFFHAEEQRSIMQFLQKTFLIKAS